MQDLKLPIFKIGRSSNVEKRNKNYGKDSIMLFTIYCNNYIETETNLIKLFAEKFIRCKEYGYEYFTGKLAQMKKEIFNYIYENNLIIEFEDSNMSKLNIINKLRQNIYNPEIIENINNIEKFIINENPINLQQIKNICEEVQNTKEAKEPKKPKPKEIKDVLPFEKITRVNGKFECSRCGYETTKLSSLKNHLSRKLPCEDIFRCKILPADLLRSLGKDDHEFPYKCDLCDHKFKTNSGRYKHQVQCKLEKKNQEINILKKLLLAKS